MVLVLQWEALVWQCLHRRITLFLRTGHRAVEPCLTLMASGCLLTVPEGAPIGGTIPSPANQNPDPELPAPWGNFLPQLTRKHLNQVKEAFLWCLMPRPHPWPAYGVSKIAGEPRGGRLSIMRIFNTHGQEKRKKGGWGTRR